MMEIFLICCYAKNQMGYENLSAMSRFKIFISNNESKCALSVRALSEED